MNQEILKFKGYYGYERLVTDKLKINYLRTIRFKSKKK